MRPKIRLTEPDYQRLTELTRSENGRDSTERLEEELERAAVVPPSKVPRGVATMRSLVRFEDVDTGEKSEVAIVYPWEANPIMDKISVLAPVGTALLGLSEGVTIEWPTPKGNRKLKLLSVLYQPEAHGRYDL